MPAVGFSFLSVSPASLPSRAAAAFPSRRRRSSTPPPCARAATADVRPRRSRTLAAPPCHAAPPAQPFCAACARSRHHRRLHLTPPPPLSSQPTQPRRCSRTLCRPRSRASTPFTPQPQPISARQVFDRLPVRDGSRKEEGKGSCGREARSQADSCREGGRVDREGGQGRRGAGIRPCSFVPDQGGPQRQRQRQGYGQSERCQGHQSRDGSSSRVRSVRYSCRFRFRGRAVRAVSGAEHTGVTDSTTVWPHSADIPSSRDFTSDRASHWTEDARRSPATGASQVHSSSSSS